MFQSRSLDDLTQAHSRIKGNIAAYVHWAARQRGAWAYAGQFLLRIGDNFLCPDVMVVPDENVQCEAYASAACFLAEVLSPSTAQNDRIGKYAMYTSIPTLQTYLMAEQDERRVYPHQREGTEWVLRELVGEGEIHIPCLGLRISLDDVYAGVV